MRPGGALPRSPRQVRGRRTELPRAAQAYPTSVPLAMGAPRAATRPARAAPRLKGLDDGRSLGQWPRQHERLQACGGRWRETSYSLGGPRPGPAESEETRSGGRERGGRHIQGGPGLQLRQRCGERPGPWPQPPASPRCVRGPVPEVPRGLRKLAVPSLVRATEVKRLCAGAAC